MRERTSPPQVEEGDSPPEAAQRDSLADLADIAGGPEATRSEVERLHQGIRDAARSPSRAVADQLHAVIAEPRFARTVGLEGLSTRHHAVGALLAMGYPYALEVDPAQLLTYRKTGLGMVAVGLSSGVSLLFYLALSLDVLTTTPSRRLADVLLTLAVLIGLGHAVHGAAAALNGRPSVRSLRWLVRGWPLTGALFFIGASLVGAADWRLVAFAAIFSLPAFLVSMTGWFAKRRLLARASSL